MRHALISLSLLACDASKEPLVPSIDDPIDTDAPTDTDEPTVPVPLCDQPGVLCTAAGTGAWGFLGDGPALQTAFYQPTAVLIGLDARLEIADFNNHRIRVLEDDLIVTIAGNGYHANAIAGPALASPMENPVDVARCSDDRFYLAELHAARVDYVDSDGTLGYFAGLGGEPGYAGDGGPATQAQLYEPTGVACGPDGSIYISDSVNNVIRVVSPDGLIATLAGTPTPGFADGTADEAAFFRPTRLVVHEGAVYVADWLNSAIRRISLPDGTVTTVAGTGVPGFSGDGGPADQAQLNFAIGLDFGPDGAMYIADSDNHVIRKVDPDGIITTIAGQPCGPELDANGRPVSHPGFSGDGGPATAGQFNWPNDVTVDAAGKLWIADTLNSMIRTVQLP